MYRTAQENFWAGEFGDEYISRNSGGEYLASNVALFSEIIGKTDGNIESIIEFGPNIGMNLKAVKLLKPNIKCAGIEINEKAANILSNDGFFGGDIQVINDTILEAEIDEKFDFVLIKGVLIHINPEALQEVYQKLYEVSKKYICIAEYYNPSPVSITYRGNEERLFKRDFAGEFMDKFPNCKVVDYGFKWHRDNNFCQDDVTWFLLEKQ